MLIQCTQCSRQHDFAGRPPGTKAFCRCGAALTLPAPVTPTRHVGCPQCGGQIDHGKAECSHCGTAFAAVSCPVCFCMALQQDRHCAQCGSALSSPARRVHSNGHMPMPCPRCRIDLNVVLLDSFAVDGCPQCSGLFLNQRTMIQLLKNRHRLQPIAAALDANGARADTHRVAGCPECEQPMYQRRHHGKSGVVVDVCDDHGIWLDGSELSDILQSRGKGGGKRSRKHRGRGDGGRSDKRVRHERAERRASADGFAVFWFVLLDDLIDLIKDLLDELDIDFD